MQTTTQKTSVDMSDGNYFAATLGLFWYAVHNYNGMECPLYALQCRIRSELQLHAADSTEPGSSRYSADENWDTQAVYDALESGEIDPEDLYSDIATAISAL